MKHKEIAQAWLNGETVQMRGIDSGNWTDLIPADESVISYHFHDDTEYRRKPSADNEAPENSNILDFTRKLSDFIYDNAGDMPLATVLGSVEIVKLTILSDMQGEL